MIENTDQEPGILFGEMRQALHGSASEVSFAVVLDAFTKADDRLGSDGSRSWMSYAESLLEGWPEETRRAQGSLSRSWLDTNPPHWLRLIRSVGIRNTFIQREGFERFVTSPSAQMLSSLDLKMCRFQLGSLESLSVPGNLPALRSLELGVLNGLKEREVISLASSTLYSQLESLRFTFGLEANPTYVRELVTSTQLENLKILRPGCHDMGTLAAVALAEAAHMSGLVELDFAGNDLGEEGAIALAEAAHLSKLTVLMLARNYIGPGGAIALCEAPHFANLELLDLRENFIGARGARAIARAPHLANLRVLDLQKNALGDDGARAIAQSPNLSSLVVLDLGENGITGAGARALATSPYLAESIRDAWRS